MQQSFELLPIFGSGLNARLVAHLVLTEHTLTGADLARALGVTPMAVSRVLPKLIDAGLVERTRVGNAGQIRARTDTPYYLPLRHLLQVTVGAPVVLGRALARVGGVERALIYGSWAARLHGDVGPMPRDVDVLVGGAPDRADLAEACAAAEEALGREVGVSVVDAEEMSVPSSTFVANILSGAWVHVPLAGNDDAGARVGGEEAVDGSAGRGDSAQNAEDWAREAVQSLTGAD